MLTRAPASPPSAGDVLGLIRRGEASTRGEVARATGLSRTAVTARLSALMGSGLVVEGEEGPSTGGRPPSRLRFNARAGVVLAVALGRSRTQVAVCALDGEVLAAAEFDHEDGAGPDEMMPRVRTTFDRLLKQAKVGKGAVRGVGLSLPGTVDVEHGMSLSSPIMKGWDGIPLAPYFAHLGDIPVRVENDANALALSEALGHLTRFPDLVVLKASTGIGVGVFSDGRLLRGASGAAGEVGHTKIAAAAGRGCRCGDVGCLEAVAAGWALVQDSAKDGRPVAHVRELVARAVAGDADARRRVRDSGRRMGEVLAGVVNLLNPSAVVVGGDMAAAYDTFVAGLRETLYAESTALASRELEILPSTYGVQAGVVGCAQLALADVLSASSVDRALAAVRR
ncbi:MAG TPA: ROK family transcriptional regulator [Nocardioidaceae bacterium]|nr:ROK family transcriptional regulator [Nocardioidaceae bacterium]